MFSISIAISKTRKLDLSIGISIFYRIEGGIGLAWQKKKMNFDLYKKLSKKHKKKKGLTVNGKNI